MEIIKSPIYRITSFSQMGNTGLLDKWDGLEKALGTDADVLVVAFPEVLGDTYTELVINLGRIAESGKSLGITKGSPWLLKGGEMDL